MSMLLKHLSPRQLAILGALLFLSVGTEAKSRQVILMIGDGMGFPVMGSGQTENDLVRRKASLALKTAMEKGRVGLVSTRSASHLVTDSAAAATAMATGVKTHNDVVGMDEDGRPLESLFEIAMSRSLSVGFVTTDSLTGATPAGFTAHVSHRRQSGSIAQQQLQKRFTVLLGGGKRDFDLTAARRSGFTVFANKTELLKAKVEPDGLWLGVFHEAEIPFVSERGANVPSLPEMTEKALAKLAQDSDGFLLVVEGARIDHAEHSNQPKKVLDEFLEFDDTLRAVMDFVARNDQASLFVTADHDTGGLALTKIERNEDYPTLEQFSQGQGVHWVSQNHTASPVVLIGLGPDGALAGGWHENTDICLIVKKALSF